jgi:hypothetical protein
LRVMTKVSPSEAALKYSENFDFAS